MNHREYDKEFLFIINKNIESPFRIRLKYMEKFTSKIIPIYVKQYITPEERFHYLICECGYKLKSKDKSEIIDTYPAIIVYRCPICKSTTERWENES